MQVETFRLWKNAPGMCEEVPTITAYLPERGKKQGAVVILPGGGYCNRAPHEGMGYAEYLAVHGYSSFVVDYRVFPHEFPLPLLDARRGIRFVRYHAEKFGIHPNKVAIMGSSAGGHLSALTSTYFAPIDYEGTDELDGENFVPDAQILCYPVIDLHTPIAHEGSGKCLLGDRYDADYEKLIPRLLVSEKTPQAFIWHTFEDGAVDVRNSLQYASALREKGISTELHVFPHGEHGKGRSEAEDKVSRHDYQWNSLLLKWLEYINF